MRIYHKYPSFHTLNAGSNSSVTHKSITAFIMLSLRIITRQCAYENLRILVLAKLGNVNTEVLNATI